MTFKICIYHQQVFQGMFQNCMLPHSPIGEIRVPWKEFFQFDAIPLPNHYKLRQMKEERGKRKESLTSRSLEHRVLAVQLNDPNQRLYQLMVIST